MEQRDFFISYTKADKAEADWIAATLIRHGYSVYIQTRDIGPADSFVEKMEGFMDNSRSFIAVWSKNYSRSKFAMWEFRAAFTAQRHGQMELLLPVCVENYPLPRLYAHIVHADLYGVAEAEKTRRLLNAVGYRGTVWTGSAQPPPKPEPQKPPPDPLSPEPHRLTVIPAFLAFLLCAVLVVVVVLFWGGKTLNGILLYELGYDYQEGIRVEQDYTTAREYYEQAAEMGNASALYNLGYLYQYGLGVDVNYTTAREYYEQAAEKGEAVALNNLGYLYSEGLGVEQDYTTAREYYEQAAEKGSAFALNQLGYLYRNGLGVEVDYEKAREYYEQAAEKGEAVALNNLGYLYEYGHGVDVDYTTAEWYYQQAIDKGETKAALGNLQRLREKMANS